MSTGKAIALGVLTAFLIAGFMLYGAIKMVKKNDDIEKSLTEQVDLPRNIKVFKFEGKRYMSNYRGGLIQIDKEMGL